jgi:hemolysin-activating ACP:hemolysin acyltransferase
MLESQAQRSGGNKMYVRNFIFPVGLLVSRCILKSLKSLLSALSLVSMAIHAYVTESI